MICIALGVETMTFSADQAAGASTTGTATVLIRLPSRADTSYTSTVPRCSRAVRQPTTTRYAPRQPPPQPSTSRA